MRLRYGFGTFLLELVMIAAGLVFLFPVYALITLSLKDKQQIAASPLAPPTSPSLGNFADAWERASLGSALLNSTVITVASLLLLIAIGSFAAYFLARRATRLGFGLYVLFLLGIVLPFQLGMIPLFRMVDGMGLLGTYQGLIVFYTGIHRYDVALRPGPNTIEIVVYGTLAPHLDETSPTHFVFAGQRSSGLFGPVLLRRGGYDPPMNGNSVHF